MAWMPIYCYKCGECGKIRCVERPMGHSNWPLPCDKCDGEMERDFETEQSRKALE